MRRSISIKAKRHSLSCKTVLCFLFLWTCLLCSCDIMDRKLLYFKKLLDTTVPKFRHEYFVRYPHCKNREKFPPHIDISKIFYKFKPLSLLSLNVKLCLASQSHVPFLSHCIKRYLWIQNLTMRRIQEEKNSENGKDNTYQRNAHKSFDVIIN